MMAIYCTASISGAHLNPAVSLALAITRPRMFPSWKLLPFWFAQYLGGFVAGCVNYLFWRSTIIYFEESRAIVRDSCNGVQTAMMFGEYFPNPGDGWYVSENNIDPAWCDRAVTDRLTGHGGAFFVEMLGTAILMLVILSVTDKNNVFLGNSGLPPLLIGLTVSMIISFCAPLTQAVKTISSSLTFCYINLFLSPDSLPKYLCSWFGSVAK